MRAAFVSDLHLDWRTHGVARLAEVERSLAGAVRLAVSRRVDLFGCLGDVANPDSGMVCFKASAALVRAARELEAAGIPQVWVAGNHDVSGEGEHGDATSLSALRGFYDGKPSFWIAEGGPTTYLVGDAVVVCLPFTPPSRPYDPGAFVREAARLRADAEARGRKRLKLLVLSHLTSIDGMQPGEETKDLPRGREVRFPVEALAESMPDAIVVQGHYHRRQVFRPRHPGAPPIHVVGSLARLTHGEEAAEPGVLFLEF